VALVTTTGSGGPDAVPGAGGQWRSPSPRLWVMRRAEVVVACAVVAGAVGGAAGSASAAAGFGGAAGAVVLGAAVLVFVRNRFRSWRYLERDEDLIVARGVMFRRLSVVPYGRMQFVDVTAGPLERGFGLATVKLHTAAAATDARIPGLERQEADRLRNRLSALGEAKAQGL